MLFRGIIFDFNGVLWWDSHLQEQAWRDFARVAAGRSLSDEDIALHVHGRNNRITLEYLFGRALDGEAVARYIEEKESAYRRLCLEQGTAFQLSPGAVGLLDALVGRGIPHTIATASERTNLGFFFTHLDLARWFDMAQVVYDDGIRPGKPAPDGYLQAASNLGLPPAACVVVEDSRAGIEAAKRAGIGHIMALGPPPAHEALAALPGVNQVVAQLGDVDVDMLFGGE